MVDARNGNVPTGHLEQLQCPSRGFDGVAGQAHALPVSEVVVDLYREQTGRGSDGERLWVSRATLSKVSSPGPLAGVVDDFLRVDRGFATSDNHFTDANAADANVCQFERAGWVCEVGVEVLRGGGGHCVASI